MRADPCRTLFWPLRSTGGRCAGATDLRVGAVTTGTAWGLRAPMRYPVVAVEAAFPGCTSRRPRLLPVTPCRAAPTQAGWPATTGMHPSVLQNGLHSVRGVAAPTEGMPFYGPCPQLPGCRDAPLLLCKLEISIMGVGATLRAGCAVATADNPPDGKQRGGPRVGRVSGRREGFVEVTAIRTRQEGQVAPFAFPVACDC
jgi:hypothetical protein